MNFTPQWRTQNFSSVQHLNCPFIDSVSSFLKSRKLFKHSFFYFESYTSSLSTMGFFLSSSSLSLWVFTQSFNTHSLSLSYIPGTLLSVRDKNTSRTRLHLGAAPSLERRNRHIHKELQRNLTLQRAMETQMNF